MGNKILVTRTAMPPIEEYVKEIQPLWDSHWITNMGVKHEQLRAQLKQFLNVEQIELMTNGHMALELSLQAMNLSGEVITTPFTFASTTHAIIRNGLKPVFCDIDKDDFTIDTDCIESLITDRTSAIVPVHVYGNICNVEEIDRIAKKYGLKVLYDAAHAFGETYKGKGVGSFGDASCFSFHATKVYHTIEGGAVCFCDAEFGEALYKLKNFGICGPEKVIAVGANAKMNEFCAAMGICNLRHVDEWIKKRKAVNDRYVRNLSHTEGISFLKPREDASRNYAYMPVIFDGMRFKRNEIYEKLLSENIYSRKYFYPCVNAYDCYRDSYDPHDTETALSISERILTLPIYPELSAEDVDRICEIITG